MTQAEVGSQGHIALKLTGFLALENLSRISAAQDIYLADILGVKHGAEYPAADVSLDKATLEINLIRHGVDLNEKELDALFRSLSRD